MGELGVAAHELRRADAGKRIDDEVDKILQAFHDRGYQPQFRPEYIQISEPGELSTAE